MIGSYFNTKNCECSEKNTRVAKITILSCYFYRLWIRDRHRHRHRHIQRVRVWLSRRMQSNYYITKPKQTKANQSKLEPQEVSFIKIYIYILILKLRSLIISSFVLECVRQSTNLSAWDIISVFIFMIKHRTIKWSWNNLWEFGSIYHKCIILLSLE